MIGTADLLSKPADGYTLMTLLSPMVVAPALIEGAKVDFARDIAPIGQYDWTYSVLVAPPSLPARNVKELIELMRSRAGKINFASGGYGTPAHLAGELTLSDARTAAIVQTRQYAKRQRTWFRSRMGDWTALLP